MEAELDFDGSIAIGDAEDIRDPATGYRITTKILTRRVASDTMPASGALVLKLGRPETGRFWEVKSVVVAGSDDSTVVASATWALYSATTVGGLPGITPPLFGLVVPGNGSTIPGRQTFGRDELVVLRSDDLQVAVKGAAASTSIIAIAQVWDRDVAELQDWSYSPTQEQVSQGIR